uniref:Uncharacterized protein n=2 Tax=Oryza punctata TaxID=4537 RepID=A0A0E0LD18_ORYPU
MSKNQKNRIKEKNVVRDMAADVVRQAGAPYAGGGEPARETNGRRRSVVSGERQLGRRLAESSGLAEFRVQTEKFIHPWGCALH